MTSPSRAIRIGLIANRSHQDAPDSALVQLLRSARISIQHLHIEWIVVGRTL
ncbi:MAG: methylglyoxal synthase, partial [Undibacterium sp.]|nr:methylglyoxal synthase [Undibacterium sp.]